MQTIKNYLVLSPAVLAGVVLCFFMNFFTIKCSDEKIASISGYDLAMGNDVKTGETMDDAKDTKKLPPNGWAIAALILGVGGIVVYFINSPKKFIITAVLAFAGFASVIILKMRLMNVLLSGEKQGAADMEKMGALISIVPEAGYYLVLIGFAAVGIFNVLLLKGSLPKP